MTRRDRITLSSRTQQERREIGRFPELWRQRGPDGLAMAGLTVLTFAARCWIGHGIAAGAENGVCGIRHANTFRSDRALARHRQT